MSVSIGKEKSRVGLSLMHERIGHVCKKITPHFIYSSCMKGQYYTLIFFRPGWKKKQPNFRPKIHTQSHLMGNFGVIFGPDQRVGLSLFTLFYVIK